MAHEIPRALVTTAQGLPDVPGVLDAMKRLDDVFAEALARDPPDVGDTMARMIEAGGVTMERGASLVPQNAAQWIVMYVAGLDARYKQLLDGAVPAEFERRTQRLAHYVHQLAALATAKQQLGLLRSEPSFVPPNKPLLQRATQPMQAPVPGTEELPGDEEKDGVFLRLVMFISNQMEAHRYRRRSGRVCREHFLPDTETRTGFWCEVGAIREVLTTFVSQEYSMAAWRAFFGEGGKGGRSMPMNELEAYFSNHHILQFPDVESCRYFFSFRNGIFDAQVCTFTPYGPATDALTKATANFIDADFDTAWLTGDPASVSTPAIESIFKAQGYEGLDLDFGFAHLGRMLFDADSDGWQVCWHVEGAAGTGKSLLAGIIEKFYPQGDVGVLANNVEGVFGMSQLSKTLVVIAPELDGQFSLQATLFKSMVAGDTVSLPVKYGNAVSMVWKARFFMASNSDPFSNMDNSQSAIWRRIVWFHFPNVIPESQRNTNLGVELMDQLGCTLVRAACTYKEFREKIGTGSFWNFFEQKKPPMLTSARNTFMMLREPINAFLQDTEVVSLGAQYTTTRGELMGAYRDYLKSHAPNHKFGRWNDANFIRDFGPRFEITQGRTPQGGVVFHGVGLRNLLPGDPKGDPQA